MTAYRVLISGWRNATVELHNDIVREALAPVASLCLPRDITLVHGQCPTGGIDLIAHNLAVAWGWNVEPHPARNHPTEDFGPWPGCGPLRNRHMCKLGADWLFAFPGPGSKGTWNCLMAAQEFGIPFTGYPITATGRIARPFGDTRD